MYSNNHRNIHTHVRAVAQLCLTLQPMDCSPPGSSVRGISQARIPEWVVWPGDRTCTPCGFCMGSWILYHCLPGKPPPPHTHITYFLAVPRGMWDLSSPTWGWTYASCRGGSVLATGRPGNSLKHSLTFVCLWFNLSRLSCMWQSWWRKLI